MRNHAPCFKLHFAVTSMKIGYVFSFVFHITSCFTSTKYCKFNRVKNLKTMLKTVLIVLIISTRFHGNAAQTICPVRPASNTRGPPGVPGRPGNKGEPGYGKFIET